MATIRDVVRYIVARYPYEQDLSKTRLTKLVFLADWYAAQQLHRQMTPIQWFFDHYGPYVPDVFDVVAHDDQLLIVPSMSAFGGSKQIVRHRASAPLITPSLTAEDQAILDQVIQETQDLSWSSFITYIYQTYPIRSRERYTVLPLVTIAQEFTANG